MNAVSIAQILSAVGRHGSAARMVERGLERSPDDPAWLLALAEVRAAAGEEEAARRALARARASGVPPFEIGLVHGLLGETDEAYRWLQEGGWTLWDRGRLEFDPRYEPIRADPRWDPLFERIKEELDVEG